MSSDVPDFEYTPLPDCPGPFSVSNLPNEEAVLRAFLAHIREARPQVLVTYHGDFFDWPFVEARCRVYGVDVLAEVGVGPVGGADAGGGGTGAEFRGRTAVHMGEQAGRGGVVVMVVRTRKSWRELLMFALAEFAPSV